MKVVAAVLAAGSGLRFGADKVQAPLRGKPLWKWSFDALLSHPEIDEVGLVASADNVQRCAALAAGASFVVAGGSTRQESSRIAVTHMPEDSDIAVIHDAARPFVRPETVSAVIAAAARSGAAAPGAPVTDTIRRLSATGSELIDRRSLAAMQTPQAARYSLLREAHERAASEATEELALLEAIGVEPEIVPGDPGNFKVTYESDLRRAAAELGPPETRTGIGYDAHRFSEDLERPLVLGGVRFSDSGGLTGHSDADALVHAAVDALLGAAGLGDIGEHFPNTDPRWKGASSLEFLRFAAERLKEAGWTVLNLDCTVIAERPRILERSEEIRAAMSDALATAGNRISVKATTNERMGAVGREEGIAALAVATIRQTY